jgi:hypothetical protein
MIETLTDWIEAVERDGFAVVPDAIGPEDIDALAEAIDRLGPVAGAPERGGRTYALRDLLRRVPEVRRLAGSEALRRVVEPILGPGAFAVRGLLFDKTPEANWLVPWHQDLTIAVRRRVEAPGLGPWTLKGGVPHVRPPAGVLERMLTVRVHLDDCGPVNAPLWVIPGSHRDGMLGDEAVRDRSGRRPPVSCPVGRGDVLVMRPLILHASSAATRPGRRRVIHLEYAADPLSEGLEWAEVVVRSR